MPKPKRVERSRRGLAGLAKARAAGVKLGRPKINVKLENRIKRHLTAGTGILKTARLAGVGTGTVQWIKAELGRSAWPPPAASVAALEPAGPHDPAR